MSIYLTNQVLFATLVMNDQASMIAKFTISPYYYIDVRSIDGIDSGGDIRYESHNIPGGVGERSNDVLRAGQTITLSGLIQAGNLTRLNEGIRAMQHGFDDRTPQPLKVQAPGEPQIYVMCRTSQPYVPVLAKPGSTSDFYRAAWTVALRADDPRTYLVSGATLYPTWQATA